MSGRLPIPGTELALTFDGLRDLTRLPASIAVVGGADTGCQLALILADFGAQVTLVEASPRLVPHEDGSPRSDAFEGFESSGSDRLDERLIIQFVLVGVALGEVGDRPV